MDNGLIFPYPCTCANAESLMLSFLIKAFGLREGDGPRG